MKIVTGRVGEDHVSSYQMQAFQRGILGDFAILNIGEKLRGELISSRVMRVYSGCAVAQGVYCMIPYNAYDELFIDTVTPGYERMDIVYIKYQKAEPTGIESAELYVGKGDEATSSPVWSLYGDGADIWSGSEIMFMPLFRLRVTSESTTIAYDYRQEYYIKSTATLEKMIGNTYTKAEIDAKMTSVYTSAGNITCANLTSILLNADHLGFVYNITDDGLTTSDFVEGEGKEIHTGSNVAVINVGTNSNPVYKFDLWGGNTDYIIDYINEYLQDKTKYTCTITNGLVRSEAIPVTAGNKLLIESPMFSVGDYSQYHISFYVDASHYKQGSTIETKSIDWGEEEWVTVPDNATLMTFDFYAGGGASESFPDDIRYINVVTLVLDTKADKSTTLAGYGITDAYTADEVDDSIGYHDRLLGSMLQREVFNFQAPNVGFLPPEKNPYAAKYSSYYRFVLKGGRVRLARYTKTVQEGVISWTKDEEEIITYGYEKLARDYVAKATAQIYDMSVLSFVPTLFWFTDPLNENVFTEPLETYYNNNDVYMNVLTGECYKLVPVQNTYLWLSQGFAPRCYQGSKTTSGSLITLTDASESNLVECTAEIEAVQEGSGDPSPDNIRPITGQTEVVITDNGINQWDEQWELGSIDGTTGEPVSNSNIIRSKNFNRCYSGKTYYCKASSGANVHIYYYDTFMNYISKQDGFANNTVTTPSNAVYFKIIIFGSTYNNNVSVNYPSTDHDYHAYKGKTYTIQLGDTIYGGELDVLTGELTVTHGEVMYDGSSDEGWQLSSSWSGTNTNVFYANVINGALFDRYDVDFMKINNCFQTYSRDDLLALDDNGIGFSGSRMSNAPNPTVRIDKTIASDLTNFTTWLSNNPLQVIYELATPYTIQLTPQQIKLLKGTNNLSCNTGDLSIKYYPDNVLGQLKGDIESEYDNRVETLETQTQELQPSLTFMSRERRNITSDLGRLSTAAAEQNLAKYGYKIGDYFTGASGYTYILADYNTFKGTSTPYCIASNHLGIVVDTHQTSQWHSGDASNVGYNGSVLNTFLKGTVLDTIKTDFKALFGGSTGLEHLIAHSKLYTTALANWAWQANQYISALTCTQIDAGSQWTANGFQEGEASKSLELFRKHKWTEIFESRYPWLRNLSNYSGGSGACYAAVYGVLDGGAGVANAYYVVGLIIFH